LLRRKFSRTANRREPERKVKKTKYSEDTSTKVSRKAGSFVFPVLELKSLLGGKVSQISRHEVCGALICSGVRRRKHLNLYLLEENGTIVDLAHRVVPG
jgi:hypothetical protein